MSVKQYVDTNNQKQKVGKGGFDHEAKGEERNPGRK
jgi:hypothetical protein